MIRSIVLMVCLAGPAQALSCLRPDVVDLYEHARDSSDTYFMVRGKLRYENPPKLPQPNEKSAEGAAAESPALLQGVGLGPSGFSSPFEREIILSLTCLTVWCPGAPEEGKELFIALRHQSGDLILDQSACPSNAIPVAPGDEARLIQCHKFGRCVSNNGF